MSIACLSPLRIVKGTTTTVGYNSTVQLQYNSQAIKAVSRA